MGLLRAVGSAITSTLSDQWKEIITADTFNEHTLIVPGILKTKNNGHGENANRSASVISNGSKIFVPENTAAFIFNQSKIENIITTPGVYEYSSGEESIFNGDGIRKSILKQVVDRVGFGGIPSTQSEIAFVNLREIRNIKFGTRGPQVYNDLFYECDLEIYAYGSFSIKISDTEKFIRNFVPANTKYYSIDDKNVRSQLISDFLQSFIVALNSLSKNYRISQIPSQANDLSITISNDPLNAGSWKERFGIEIVKVSIENIEFSPKSQNLIDKYNSNKMSLSAYESISQKASNIAAQQKIAEGIKDNGFGDVGGMILGMNMTQNIGSFAEPKKQSSASFDEQIEKIKKLKELVDMGIISEEEFAAKKKELLEL